MLCKAKNDCILHIIERTEKKNVLKMSKPIGLIEI